MAVHRQFHISIFVLLSCFLNQDTLFLKVKAIQLESLQFLIILLVQLYTFKTQANIGQDEDFDAARKKAIDLGAKKVLTI